MSQGTPGCVHADQGEGRGAVGRAARARARRRVRAAGCVPAPPRRAGLAATACWAGRTTFHGLPPVTRNRGQIFCPTSQWPLDCLGRPTLHPPTPQLYTVEAPRRPQHSLQHPPIANPAARHSTAGASPTAPPAPPAPPPHLSIVEVPQVGEPKRGEAAARSDRELAQEQQRVADDVDLRGVQAGFNRFLIRGLVCPSPFPLTRVSCLHVVHTMQAAAEREGQGGPVTGPRRMPSCRPGRTVARRTALATMSCTPRAALVQ